jgi:Zn-dependent peptidase ImmA (M78 family)/transcriptional regulator with XRE-family HTH domain
MSKKNYHVTHRVDGNWAVIGEGNRRASSIHTTQAEAIAAAKPLTQRIGGELRIHGRNNRIREGWSYGHDPRTPEPAASPPNILDKKKAEFAEALGERLTSARKMRGESLRSLAEKLAEISHTTLQKFEKGLVAPDSNMLSKISDSLQVRMSYFIKKPRYHYAQVEWRKGSKVGVKIQRQLEFEALDFFERYLELETLLGVGSKPLPLKNFQTLKEKELPEAIETLADELRSAWGLGSNPLPNVHSMLEELGVKVRILPGSEGFDGLSSFLEGGDERVPVVALSDECWKNRVDLPRFRLTALHELGHLVMRLPEGLEHKDKEGFCHRFASAFLFPREQFRESLGNHRTKLPISEAKLLKPIWGMSIAAILRRAKDLGVIKAGAYKAFCIWNNSARGFGKDEPKSWRGSEDSERFKRLVLRGFSEGIITSSKAADLLGVSLDELAKEADSLI